MLDANGDYVFGGGQASFWRDVPDAPAQAVKTRLLLYLGEFFLDVTDGTDWRGQALGPRTTSTRDAVLRERILGTPGVLSIDSYSSNLNRTTRAFTVSVTVSTIYGAASVVAPFFNGALIPTFVVPPPLPPPVTPPAAGPTSGSFVTDPSGGLVVDPGDTPLYSP